MKKLDLFLLRNFAGPFVASFFVTLVILVIQFLSRYQEDILGKGFEGKVLVELFLYTCVSLTLLALPMGMLMASLMTLGGLGERYELLALKAAGISMQRILRPYLVLGFLAWGISFYIASYFVPWANRNMYALLYDMERARPILALQPGVFSQWVEGVALRIGKRQPPDKAEDVLLYLYAPDGKIQKTLTAPAARIYVDKVYRYLVLHLFNGCQYEFVSQPEGFQRIRLCFDSLLMRIDISQLGLRRSDEKLFASHYYVLTLPQLPAAVDSLHRLEAAQVERLRRYWAEIVPSTPLLGSYVLPQEKLSALGSLQSTYRYLESEAYQIEEMRERIRRYELEWYNKFFMPLGSFVFLILGASLGALLRRGGLGMPLVVSTVFFIVYYVLLTQGKKLAREGVLTAWIGSALPILITLPITLYLFLLVNTEAPWLQPEYWKKRFLRP
ncbi:MAG: LptF/LptG family permease [Bacteroidia bacterium]